MHIDIVMYSVIYNTALHLHVSWILKSEKIRFSLHEALIILSSQSSGIAFELKPIL